MISLGRLALRIQRFEFGTVALLVLLVGVSALIVRARLDGVGATVECFEVWLYGSGPFGAGACEGPVSTFLAINQDEAAPIIATMQALPLVVGLVLGVSLVGREIESGTAVTAWALAASRRRWLAGRLIPVLAALLGLLAFSAIASEILAVGRNPWIAGGVTFQDAGEHGPGIVARGVAAFGIAAAVGAALGRMLPAVLVSAALLLGLWIGGDVALVAWLDSARREVMIDAPSRDDGVWGITDQYWRTPAGQRLTEAEAWAMIPADVTEPLQDVWLAEHLERVVVGVPASEYPAWSAFETAGFTAVGALGLVVVYLIVDRRRPV